MKYAEKDISAADYDSYWEKVGVFADERVEEIASLCAPVASAIDLGGGSGALAKRLNATLVDWSPVACELAKEHGVDAICADLIEFLATHRKTYDLVILADVIEEMKESQTKALLEGARLLCTKYLIVSTPTHENYLNVSTHQVIYSKTELETMLKDLGFKKDEEIWYTDRLIARFVVI